MTERSETRTRFRLPRERRSSLSVSVSRVRDVDAPMSNRPRLDFDETIARLCLSEDYAYYVREGEIYRSWKEKIVRSSVIRIESGCKRIRRSENGMIEIRTACNLKSLTIIFLVFEIVDLWYNRRG